VGVLGGWGSGKTFAMHLMKEEMARIRTLSVPKDEAWPDAAEPDAFPYVGHVYMINFDAWTYAKSDLWASLMQTILQGLNRQLFLESKIDEILRESQSLLNSGEIWRCIYNLPKQQKSTVLNTELGVEALQELQKAKAKLSSEELQSQLWENLKTVKKAESDKLEKVEEKLHKKETKLNKTRRRLEEALQKRAVDKASQVTLEATMSPLSKAIMRKIGCFVQMEMDLDTADVDQMLTLSPTLKDVGNVLKTDWYWYLGLFFLFGTSVVLSVVLENIQIPAFITASFSIFSMIIKFAGQWKKSLLYGLQEYRKQISIGIEELRKETDSSLSEEWKAFKTAKEEMAEARAEVALHKERLGLTARYRTLQEFIKERLRDGAYEAELGPMHEIQRDIAEITSDFTVLENDPQKEQKKEVFPRGPARIVLFIDDLDRCSPDKVVEMLEAVQILIKTSLFVVVMAVDVRFITRALENEYHGILTRRGDPSGLDYIEKIIQIPYRVRTIDPSAVRTYLRSQMEIEERETESTEKLSSGEPGSKPRYRTGAPREEAPENDLEHRLPRDVIKFTQEEFKIIEETCGSIGLTPRSVKRLVNVYKILKIIWFRSNRYAEPDSKVKKATIALLALAARYPDFMRDALWQLDNWINQIQRNHKLQDCLPCEEDQCNAYMKRECVQLVSVADDIMPRDLQVESLSERNHKLQDCLPREEDQCNAYMKRECVQLGSAADDIMPKDLRVESLPGGILDLIRSFSFVGDIGYSPDEDGQKYAHQMSSEKTAN